jgi:hypothetical protein
MIFVKKTQADAVHERTKERSTLLKNLLLTPFTGGLPLIRQLFGASRKNRE